jgi:hypothetical protein
MKFSIGDPIVINKSGEEGHIVDLLGNDMAEIMIGKTIFPIYLTEIDHPYLRWFTEKNKQNKQKKYLPEQLPLDTKPLVKPKIASGIHLTFMPIYHTVDMEERVERLKVFVLNETHYTIQFSYDVRVNDASIFNYEGLIQPFADLYLHFVDWEKMNAIPRFIWKIKETQNEKYAEHSDVLKIRAVKLFEHISKLQIENLPTFSYLLAADFKEKEKGKEKITFNQPIPTTKLPVKSMNEIPKYELDLHIEAIIEHTKGLSSADMIQLQLAELNKYLRIAINNFQDKMVIVHGIGKGTLRQEVHRTLKGIHQIESFESGWQSGYGFGATIVFFKY